jgi:hypothetical protein
MENSLKEKRPNSVTLIAIFFIINAISGISSTTTLWFSSMTRDNPEIFADILAWSPFLKYSPYALYALLIISMVLFFLLKKSSILVFASYLALNLVINIQKALAPNWFDTYGVRGLVTLFSSFLIGLIVFGYMISLRNQKILE